MICCQNVVNVALLRMNLYGREPENLKQNALLCFCFLFFFLFVFCFCFIYLLITPLGRRFIKKKITIRTCERCRIQIGGRKTNTGSSIGSVRCRSGVVSFDLVIASHWRRNGSRPPNASLGSIGQHWYVGSAPVTICSPLM